MCVLRRFDEMKGLFSETCEKLAEYYVGLGMSTCVCDDMVSGSVKDDWSSPSGSGCYYPVG